MAIFQTAWENLEPESWIYHWGWRMRSAECLCLLPSSAEIKIVWHSWGLSHRCAGCQGLGYLSFYVLEELKRISEDWRTARLLGDQECEHTALELVLHCHWEENCSTSPCNSSFMDLLFTMEKVRWYLQELKFFLQMRWSEAERDPGFFLPHSLLISVKVTASCCISKVSIKLISDSSTSFLNSVLY